MESGAILNSRQRRKTIRKLKFRVGSVVAQAREGHHYVILKIFLDEMLTCSVLAQHGKSNQINFQSIYMNAKFVNGAPVWMVLKY